MLATTQVESITQSSGQRTWLLQVASHLSEIQEAWFHSTSLRAVLRPVQVYINHHCATLIIHGSSSMREQHIPQALLNVRAVLGKELALPASMSGRMRMDHEQVVQAMHQWCLARPLNATHGLTLQRGRHIISLLAYAQGLLPDVRLAVARRLLISQAGSVVELEQRLLQCVATWDRLQSHAQEADIPVVDQMVRVSIMYGGDLKGALSELNRYVENRTRLNSAPPSLPASVHRSGLPVIPQKCLHQPPRAPTGIMNNRSVTRS